MPFLTDVYGNPNSIHREGRRAREAVEEAREVVAACLGASPNEIVFTGGGSESNNLAIRGVVSARHSRGRHIVLSAVEHPSVLDTCRALERDGVELSVVEVDGDAVVDPERVARAIRPDTVLVCLMHANNEVGTIEPVEDVAGLCRERRVSFHVDAVQTAGKLPIDVAAMGADLLAISGHKFYGPKGAGVLYVRSGARVHAQITGGGQERDRRSGTENVAGIVGLAEALRLAVEAMDEESASESTLRDRLLSTIPALILETIVTGHPVHRLPGHASFCFHGVEGEAVLLALDQLGIAASAGSACSSGSQDPPHALRAMGIPDDYARGSVRLTLGRSNTAADVDRVLETLPRVVARLRAMGASAPG